MTLGDWRDISIILLALEAIIIGLIYGAIFYFLLKGFRIAHRWLQRIGFPQGRRYSATMRIYALNYSKKAVRPFLATDSIASQTAGFVRAFFNPPNKRTRSKQ